MSARAALYGHGFQYPLQFDPNTGGVAEADAINSVRASLRRLFDASPGDDRFNPAYGCGLRAFLFELDTITLRALLDTVIRDAVGKWEPRIAAVATLNVLSDDTDSSIVHISLAVRLIQSSTVHNLVFPFATPQA